MEARDISYILAEYHNATVRARKADEGNPNFDGVAAHQYDACNEIAIDLLGKCGYTFDHTDELGVPVSEDVQTLLELAMFRSPALRMILGDFADA